MINNVISVNYYKIMTIIYVDISQKKKNHTNKQVLEVFGVDTLSTVPLSLLTFCIFYIFICYRNMFIVVHTEMVIKKKRTKTISEDFYSKTTKDLNLAPGNLCNTYRRTILYVRTGNRQTIPNI